MVAHSTTILTWTLECTPVGGVGNIITFESGSSMQVQPSAWTLTQRDDVLATVLEIRFPDVDRFLNAWAKQNPLAPGSSVVLKVNGVARFTGKVFGHKFVYSNGVRSIVITCKDKMGLLKDAVVKVNKLRTCIHPGKYNLRQDTENISLFNSVQYLVFPLNYIRPWNSTFLIPLWCHLYSKSTPNGAIASVTDNGDNTVNVNFTANHGLGIVGEYVHIIIESTANYYTGTWGDIPLSCRVVDADTVKIWTPYLGTDTGSWWKAISPRWKRIPYAEYQVLYDIGAIFLRQDPIHFLGETPDTEHPIINIRNNIWAKFVYFDDTDDSTMVSNLIREAFETSADVGGLGWTEGVDYEIVDETTGDILSGMKWDTDIGDGDCVSYIQNLYDDIRIGLSPSYWIRDFYGQGKVRAKLVAQDDTEKKDVDIVYDAAFDSPLQNIYTRATLVNNEPTRELLTRDDDMFTDVFDLSTDTSWTAGTPTETPKMSNDAVHKHILYLNDNTSKSSWGWFKIVKGWGVDEGAPYFPEDVPLFQTNLKKAQKVDIIHINCHYTFTGAGSDGISQPVLWDINGESAINGIYKIHQNQIFTVEYNKDLSATPDPDLWCPIHSELFLAEVDPMSAKDSWLTVEGIDVEARHLRVVINTPFYGRCSDPGPNTNCSRLMMWWVSEFQVFGSGKVQEGDEEIIPTVQFTDDPDDEFRCMCGIDDEPVDMYRPRLLQITEAMGLKFRTMVMENSDLWEFLNKDSEEGTTPDTCDIVSIGYKYLVTMLDSVSKENEWEVRIDPRPDIFIGDTVYSSKISTIKSYLVHQMVLQMNSGQLSQTLTLSDHISVSGGEEGDACS